MSKVIKQKFHMSHIVSKGIDVLVVLKDNKVHVHGSLFVHINCLGFTKSTAK